MPAVVDPNKCAGCAECVEVCPTEAITINGDGVAVVDAEICGDCGVCVDACPSEAITLE